MNERQNPYVGPRAFETGETLYGRERELRQLESLLIAERLVLLHAPSGAGKTSLIQAGLIPNLREQGFNVLPVIRVNLDLPGDIPAPAAANRYLFSTLVALEEAVQPRLRLGLDELMTLSLNEYLSQRPREEDTPESDLLIFDQFEEILTIAPADREGKLTFFAALGAALRNRDRWALFSMRDDYLGALEPYLRPIPGQLEHHYRLDLLSPEAALQAIQNPARESGVDFSDPAASKLVDDLRAIQAQQPDGTFERIPGQHVEPVQLQVVCYRLWEAMPEDAAQFAPEDVQKVGSVDEALGEYYAAIIVKAIDEVGVTETNIREWFQYKLITKEGIRSQVLCGQDISDGLDNRAIRLLENAHIIRAEKRSGATWYELAHDRLVEPIRSSNSQWFEKHMHLIKVRAMLWIRQNKNENLLLRGKDLEKVEKLVAEHGMSDDEDEFLAASHRAEAIVRRERRWPVILWIFTSISLLIAITTTFSWLQAKNQEKVLRDQIKISRSRELVARSELVMKKSPQLGFLLAIEALNIVNNLQYSQSVLPEQILRDSLLDVESVPLRGHERAIFSLAFSPSGRWLATGSFDKTIRLWDMQNTTVAPIVLRGHESPIIALAFSPNGHWLAISSKNATALLWDMQNPANLPSNSKFKTGLWRCLVNFQAILHERE